MLLRRYHSYLTAMEQALLLARVEQLTAQLAIAANDAGSQMIEGSLDGLPAVTNMEYCRYAVSARKTALSMHVRTVADARAVPRRPVPPRQAAAALGADCCQGRRGQQRRCGRQRPVYLQPVCTHERPLPPQSAPRPIRSRSWASARSRWLSFARHARMCVSRAASTQYLLVQNEYLNVAVTLSNPFGVELVITAVRLRYWFWVDAVRSGPPCLC